MEGEGSGVGGRHAGAVYVEGDPDFAADVAQGEVVGDRVEDAGGDADEEETDLQSGGGLRGESGDERIHVNVAVADVHVGRRIGWGSGDILWYRH